MAQIICSAMREIGIINPDSQDGIDFCTDNCPYPFCVIFEGRRGANIVNRRKAEDRKRMALEMMSKGSNMVDIAQRLGVSARTIQRALK